MTTENQSTQEIFNPEYSSAARSFETEARISGVTKAVLSVVSKLDPQDPVLQDIMEQVKRDESLETPIYPEMLAQEIGVAATYMEVQQNTKLASARDCETMAATPPAHTQDDSFAG